MWCAAGAKHLFEPVPTFCIVFVVFSLGWVVVLCFTGTLIMSSGVMWCGVCNWFLFFFNETPVYSRKNITQT